jgi:hypothetical protein
MSLWGATIEAIATAWGVPLQEVLEASEISSSRADDPESKELPKVWKMKIDTIRNPRDGGASPTPRLKTGNTIPPGVTRAVPGIADE